MGGEGDAVAGAAEQAVALGLLKDGGEWFESGRGEGAGEIGGGEAVVGAEAEEEGFFEDGSGGEALDSGEERGRDRGVAREDGQS